MEKIVHCGRVPAVEVGESGDEQAEAAEVGHRRVAGDRGFERGTRVGSGEWAPRNDQNAAQIGVVGEWSPRGSCGGNRGGDQATECAGGRVLRMAFELDGDGERILGASSCGRGNSECCRRAQPSSRRNVGSDLDVHPIVAEDAPHDLRGEMVGRWWRTGWGARAAVCNCQLSGWLN